MKLIFSLIFGLFFLPAVNAQPGGGGGLNISYITSYFKGDTLATDDPKMRINQFVLNGKGNKVIFALKRAHATDRDNNAHARKFIYLPGKYFDSKTRTARTQRLELIYDIDTMTIDFFGIMQENGAGWTEQMDQIRFTPGYFRVHLTESAHFDSCWALWTQFPDQLDKLQKDLRKGLTPETVNNLTAWRLLEQKFNPRIELFKARFFRENCEETAPGMPTKNTMLCAKMMTISESHLQIATIQEPIPINDTLTLSYRYYFVFNPLVQARIEPPNGTNLPIYPWEEEQLASKYLEALQTKSIHVNGVPFTGKIILYVSGKSFSLHEFRSTAVTHYCYSNGVLTHSYSPLLEYPQPAHPHTF